MSKGSWVHPKGREKKGEASTWYIVTGGAPERAVKPPKGRFCPRKGGDVPERAKMPPAPERAMLPPKGGEAPERTVKPPKGRWCPGKGDAAPKRAVRPPKGCSDADRRGRDGPDGETPKDGILEPSINLYRLLRVTISRLARTRVTRAVVNPIIKETTSQNESQVILGGLHILQFSPSIKLLRPDWQCLVWL